MYPNLIVHWNGARYYYTTMAGVQVSRGYRRLCNLYKYGKPYSSL